jgi:hypothetical protein
MVYPVKTWLIPWSKPEVGSKNESVWEGNNVRSLNRDYRKEEDHGKATA